ncbi:MAG TPA: type VI secretion system baseplate subunit TssG [Bryobacteraceae bacterium]|jgi:type VI secretion system protein ImpH|nr:type VI secretion system baseplate subunit TssG [Bryobacteraceae bacterium]
MATTDREPGAGIGSPQPDLRALLETDPCSVEFFQAVQILERMYPHREAVGGFVHPSREVVRFGVHNRLGFPASEIQSIEWREDGPPLMNVNFMGLTGPSGILPHMYTLFVIERRWARDRAFQEFLDMFHHRMVSLYYQARRKYKVTTSRHATEHQITQYLKDFTGIGTAGLENRQRVSDHSLIYYVGLLALQPRSAIAFENLLRDFFQAPVEIRQFVGAWYDLPRDAQCELIPEETAPRLLGLGAVAGDQIWDHSSKARIRIGPLPLKRYREFLPGARAERALEALARFFSGGQVDFDVQLVLLRTEVPEYELGGETELPLGLCSWAKTGDFERDPDDAVFSLGEEAWA